MEQILQTYYEGNAKKLRTKVDKILSQFGGICDKDKDDFYSLANEVFIDVLKRYDKNMNFDSFLYACLSNKIKTEMTKRNRIKRTLDRMSVSIDETLGEDDDTTISDFVASNYNLEEVVEQKNGIYSDKITKYLNSLSELQKRILQMIADGYTKEEIISELKISEQIYQLNLNDLKSYSKTKVLMQNNNKKKDEEMINMTTSEISKETMYSIDSIIKKIDNCSICDDHPLQRQSDQWNNKMKGDLIVTILHQYPIPSIIIAEQVLKNVVINWLIDGKQRCTNVYAYRNNIFKISRNVERPIVSYQKVMLDEHENKVLGEDGLPQYEIIDFDVRGKYYKDLPTELQERFDDYTMQVVQYLSCSNDDIEYHIRRYNAAKPMSVAQKGITHLGEQFARVVKAIANMDFFKAKGNYKPAESNNGTMDRVITESIMVTNFLSDWKKKNEDICAYLKENARISHFNHFQNLVERLSEVITEDISEMFNSKNSFLWFGIFNTFTKMNLEDEKFIDFMSEFNNSLHAKKVNDISYDDLNKKSTKDKSIVIQKLSLLEILMNEYFGIEDEEIFDEFVVDDENTKAYIDDFNDSDFVHSLDIQPEIDKTKIAIQSLMMLKGKEDLKDKNIQEFITTEKIEKNDVDDIMLYLSILDEWALNTNIGSEIYDKNNIPVLVNMVRYACDNEWDDIGEDWFTKYVDNFNGNSTFNNDKINNYNKMVLSLNSYAKYILENQ